MEGKVEVHYSGKYKKQRSRLSGRERAILDVLETDIRETSGKPHGRGWNSLGELKQYAPDAMHCHLDYRKVVIWRVMQEHSKKGMPTICKMEYVGTREKAGY